MRPNLMVTLWPSFPHFPRFATDERLSGIRLNSAMMSHPELDRELTLIRDLAPPVPVWFDVKGRQLRVAEVLDNREYLDLRLNHAVSVDAPTEILFKAGADIGLLGEVSEGGFRLTMKGNPKYRVRAGESIHLRHPSLKVHGPIFTDVELEKVEKVRRAGISRWFLSYVEEQRDVDIFREVVGPDAELMLKIESKRGLEFVARGWRKSEGVRLVAACGDLYVEVDKPHDILGAVESIVKADPEAVAGSRLLLSVVHEPVPSFADFAQLAWLHRVGYQNFMLCDELCLKGDLLATAVNAFEAFASTRAA